MEWISINTGFADMKRFHLILDDGLQLVLKYSPLQQSVRLSFRSNHQGFFLENAGAWASKIILKTVYGVEVGGFSYNGRNETGRLQIEQLALQFTIIDKNKPSVVLYEQNKKHALLTCRLPADLKHNSQIDNLQLACLCLGLGWYLASTEVPVATLKKRG